MIFDSLFVISIWEIKKHLTFIYMLLIYKSVFQRNIFKWNLLILAWWCRTAIKQFSPAENPLPNPPLQYFITSSSVMVHQVNFSWRSSRAAKLCFIHQEKYLFFKYFQHNALLFILQDKLAHPPFHVPQLLFHKNRTEWDEPPDHSSNYKKAIPYFRWNSCS